MPDKIYLDDNGNPITSGKVYLDERGEPIQSAKSNAGQSTADLQAANLKGRTDLPSTSGFLGNVASSGGKFLSDAVSGIPALAKMAGGVMQAGVDPATAATQAGSLAQAAPKMLRLAGQGVKDRYGSVDNALGTAYHDPVGVAADVSTVAGGLGLGAKVGGASKIARVLEGVSEATNPMTAMKPLAKAVEYGTAGAIRPMLKPSKILRRQQDSALEIERTALKSGAMTEGLAKSKQSAAAQRATDVAANAPGTVSRARIVALPKSLGKVEKGLSHESDLAALANVESDATASLPDAVSASSLLDKRRYLDRQLNDAFRAAERGGPPTGVKQVGQQEMLGNIRGALRETAPGIREADDETRRLGLVRSAIGDAGLRAGDIPMGAALLGGGLFAGGVPGAGALGAAFGVGRTFPQIPLAIGSVPVRATAALAKPGPLQAALLAALMGREK